MKTIRNLRGFFGKFLRNSLRITMPKNIYQLMSFDGEFSFDVNGTKVTLNNFRDEISNHIFYSGIYGNFEGYSLKIWNALCLQAKKSYVLDIGAFSGVYSLVAASANSEINIQSFEPHPNTFKILERNIDSNEFKNINLNNFALDKKDGDLLFYNSQGNSPSGFSSINHAHIEKDSGTKICKAKSIERLLETKLKDMKISLIKIDIERAELPLLKLIITRIVHDRTCVLCEVLDEEFYEGFDELFYKNNFQSILIDDLNHVAFKVDKLSGSHPLARNILFMPSDMNFDQIQQYL